MGLDSDWFILEIQNRPAIWDTRSTEYSNKVQRGRAWEEICELFVSSYDEMNSVEREKAATEMQRKWKSFRDSFRRELAKKATLDSEAETGRKEYVYYKQLLFLLPVCGTKAQAAEDGEDSSHTVEKDEFSTRPTTSKNRLNKARKRKRCQIASEEPFLLRRLAKNIETRTNERDVNDPDRHFLLSLLPHFKSIPDPMKLEVKMEFISTLKRYNQHEPVTTFNYTLPIPDAD